MRDEYEATQEARAQDNARYREQVEREHGRCDHHREQPDLKANMTRYNGVVMSRVQAVWACHQDRLRS